MRSLKSLMIASLVVAAIDCIVPRIFDLKSPWAFVFLVAFVWVSLLAFAIVGYGKRGLWLLLSAPLALYWPIWIAIFYFDPSIRP